MFVTRLVSGICDLVFPRTPNATPFVPTACDLDAVALAFVTRTGSWDRTRLCADDRNVRAHALPYDDRLREGLGGRLDGRSGPRLSVDSSPRGVDEFGGPSGGACS